MKVVRTSSRPDEAYLLYVLHVRMRTFGCLHPAVPYMQAGRCQGDRTTVSERAKVRIVHGMMVWCTLAR